jgi:hypothetical protein
MGSYADGAVVVECYDHQEGVPKAAMHPASMPAPDAC